MTQNNFNHNVTVTSEDNDIRVDKWFHRHYPELNKVFIEKLCRKGAIRIDKKRVKASYRISDGQTINIPASVVNFKSTKVDKTETKSLSKRELDDINSWLLYEDDFIIIINKPRFLASQGGNKVNQSVDSLMNIRARMNNDGKYFLTHRLDKDTSGILLMAKSPQIAANISQQFASRKISKTYLAILAGSINKVSSPIISKIIDDKEKDNRKAKEAVTDFEVIDNSAKVATLIQFMPQTGRKHQIRVHSSDVLGAPILGDYKYGFNDSMYQDVHKGLMLHAKEIVIVHPKSSQKLKITAPIPVDFKENMQHFGLYL